MPIDIWRIVAAVLIIAILAGALVFWLWVWGKSPDW
jgi:lipopolysaccharide export LptBFGC system permease protein LptF